MSPVESVDAIIGIIIAFTLGVFQGRSRWRSKPAWDGPEYFRKESVYVTGIHGLYRMPSPSMKSLKTPSTPPISSAVRQWVR